MFLLKCCNDCESSSWAAATADSGCARQLLPTSEVGQGAFAQPLNAVFAAPIKKPGCLGGHSGFWVGGAARWLLTLTA